MKSLRIDAVVGKVLFDLLLTSLALLGSYWLAVQHEFPRALSLGTPPLGGYLVALGVILVAFLWAAHTFQLYRPRRTGSHTSLFLDVVKVHLHVAMISLAVGFYFRNFSFSRVIITTFFVVNPALVVAHHFVRLHIERRRFAAGIGTRSCLVVGRGELARNFAARVRQHPWTGLEVRGFVAADGDADPVVPAEQVLGEVADLERLVEEHDAREVILALPFRAMSVLGDIDQRLSRTAIGLRSVLDLDAYNTLSREIGTFDGLPVINLRAVRTYGANAFLKRTLDLVLSSAALVLLSPLLASIAAIIWATSGRPIFYLQDRVGLDGMVFPMIKFRTMVRDAEKSTGPVWADARDSRCTRFGDLLRRTSLDELPQLLNVLRGQMSLVGPRPERPIFIDQFRETIPRYMLRHRMKAGMTGWAQVHGWRGKTSLAKRLQYDLYYLRNWSVWLDIKILLLTLVRAWSSFDLPLESPSDRRRAPVGS